MAETVPGESDVLPQNQRSASDQIAIVEAKLNQARKDLEQINEQLTPLIKKRNDASNLVYALEMDFYALIQGQLFFEGSGHG